MSSTIEREARERVFDLSMARAPYLYEGDVAALNTALDAFRDVVAARAREEGAREALAPVITAWKSLDREMNSCDYCSDPAVSNAADAVEAALGITEVRP